MAESNTAASQSHGLQPPFASEFPSVFILNLKFEEQGGEKTARSQPGLCGFVAVACLAT